MNWIVYFLQSNVTIVYRSLHAAGSSNVFSPAGWFGLLLFSMVGNMLIILPVIASLITPFTAGYFIPGIMILSVFGLFFTGVFRYVLDDSLTFISAKQQTFWFEVFRLKSKLEEVFDADQVSGLALMETHVAGIRNYKVVLVLKDERLILLHTSKAEAFAKRRLQKALQSTGLPELNDISGTPINDIQKGRVRY